MSTPDEELNPCPNCDGTKVIEVYASMDPAARLIEECCPACHGTGYQKNDMQPDFMGVPKRKLDQLLEEGFRITGFAIERHAEGTEPARGFINVGGLVGWWTPNMQAVAKAEKENADLLAQEEIPSQQEPFVWLVCSVNKDGSLSLEHAAQWPEAAHEHIYDAITEHDIDGAAQWVVRPAYLHLQQYSIDADPQGIRQQVAHAISGAMAYGAQNTNPPPEGHWLAKFWNIGRESATQALKQPAVPALWISDQYGAEFDDMTAGQGYRKGWNDCRAAMLTAAPQPEKPDCWAILTPNGSKLVSQAETKGYKHAYPLYTRPQPETYAPLTPDEVRDITCMHSGAPWSDAYLALLGDVFAIYEQLRRDGKRPVDPASRPELSIADLRATAQKHHNEYMTKTADPIEEDLYARLASLSKSLESCDRIDSHDDPDAYATILDAMNYVRGIKR